MNKDKGYGERIYKTVDKDKGNEERIYKSANENKRIRQDSKRGDEDGRNEERICNTISKEEGIEWSDLVKKIATKNSQNICNKRKQPSEDMLEQSREKKNKNCDNKIEKYSENEGEVNHYSEIDDICQIFPIFQQNHSQVSKKKLRCQKINIQKIKATMKNYLGLLVGDYFIYFNAHKVNLLMKNILMEKILKRDI